VRQLSVNYQMCERHVGVVYCTIEHDRILTNSITAIIYNANKYNRLLIIN